MLEQQSLKDVELAFLALLLRKTGVNAAPQRSPTPEERSNFYRAAGKYYQARRKDIETLGAADIPLAEIPVVLHISRYAAIDPDKIVQLRRERSWAEVLRTLHLTAEIFHVPVSVPRALMPNQKFARSARQAWRALDFEDADVVNLVNLKFASEQYGFRPEQVIALRTAGWTYPAIHAAVSGPRLVESINSRSRKSKKTRA